MEPRIQYAKTEDGVNIAFCALGEGIPLVYLPNLPITYIQQEWQIPETRRWYERLAEKRMLVHYDSRGWGLSEREVADYSLDALLRDLEAVVERLDLERFALFGELQLGPVAIAYAARHPERVSHLILWCTYARASDFYTSPRLRAMRELLQQDWELYTETMAHVLAGFSEGAPSHEGAELYRESVTRETLRATVSALREFDVMELLPQVKSPTLVLHRRQVRLLDVTAAKQLASHIPDARLMLQEGDILNPWIGETGAVLRAVDEFLGDPVDEPVDGAPASGTAIILFADIANSTRLTEELGDAAFREKARALDTALRETINSGGGTAIEGKLVGDGVLAVFGAAREAISCAQACHHAGDGVELQLHVGIHAGDVIREDDNVFGGAVNIAARISDASAVGETLVSGTVRDLARTSAGVSFEDKGERDLKGVSEPVQVFAVREQA